MIKSSSTNTDLLLFGIILVVQTKPYMELKSFRGSIFALWKGFSSQAAGSFKSSHDKKKWEEILSVTCHFCK